MLKICTSFGYTHVEVSSHSHTLFIDRKLNYIQISCTLLSTSAFIISPYSYQRRQKLSPNSLTTLLQVNVNSFPNNADCKVMRTSKESKMDTLYLLLINYLMSKTNKSSISSILYELHQKISTKLIDLARRLDDHFYFVKFFNSNVLIK